jgi:hypothetical protein
MRFILICYNLICIATTVALPAQCTSATVINDPTRNVNYAGGTQCDQNTALGSAGWYQFTGSSGTMIITYPPGLSMCNTVVTGWYNGNYPSTAGSTVTSGTICYDFVYGNCYWSNPVSVTNCNGYYVYYLAPPPTCSLGLCLS